MSTIVDRLIATGFDQTVEGRDAIEALAAMEAELEAKDAEIAKLRDMLTTTAGVLQDYGAVMERDYLLAWLDERTTVPQNTDGA